MSEAGVNRSTWQWNAKKEAAALALAQGKTWAVIHAEHNVATSTLALWVKAPEFQARVQEHLDAIVDEARRVLQRHTMAAAKRLVDLLDYGMPAHSTQVTIAKDILDRAGLKAPDKIEHTGKDGGPIEHSDISRDLHSKLSRLAASQRAAGVSGEPDAE